MPSGLSSQQRHQLALASYSAQLDPVLSTTSFGPRPQPTLEEAALLLQISDNSGRGFNNGILNAFRSDTVQTYETAGINCGYVSDCGALRTSVNSRHQPFGTADNGFEYAYESGFQNGQLVSEVLIETIVTSGTGAALSRTRRAAPSGPTFALDAGTGRALITDGPVGQRLTSQLDGCNLVMCDTAFRELDSAVTKYAGPNETAAFQSLMQRLTIVADSPSARAQALQTTRSVGANDKIIFGTADQMGIPIFTNDARFLRGAASQGVWFDAYVHPLVSMRGW